MQPSAASAMQSIAGNNEYLTGDLAGELPDESQAEQARTSRHVPVISGQLYYQQLHRMRRRADTLQEVELADSNHFFVKNEMENTGEEKQPQHLSDLFNTEASVLAAFSSAQERKSTSAVSIIPPDTLHRIATMRRNVLHDHPAVMDMHREQAPATTPVKPKAIAKAAQSASLVDELIATVMRTGHDTPPVARPCAIERHPEPRNTAFNRNTDAMPAAPAPQRSVLDRDLSGMTTAANAPAWATKTVQDFKPLTTSRHNIRQVSPSTSSFQPHTPSTRAFSYMSKKTTESFTSLTAQASPHRPTTMLGQEMNFRVSSHASARAVSTAKNLMETSRLSPKAALIRYQQAAAQPVVEPSRLQDLVEQTREREIQRVTTRLMALEGRKIYRNRLANAVVRWLEALRAWHQALKLQAQVVSTYFAALRSAP